MVSFGMNHGATEDSNSAAETAGRGVWADEGGADGMDQRVATRTDDLGSSRLCGRCAVRGDARAAGVCADRANLVRQLQRACLAGGDRALHHLRDVLSELPPTSPLSRAGVGAERFVFGLPRGDQRQLLPSAERQLRSVPNGTNLSATRTHRANAVRRSDAYVRSRSPGRRRPGYRQAGTGPLFDIAVESLADAIRRRIAGNRACVQRAVPPTVLRRVPSHQPA